MELGRRVRNPREILLTSFFVGKIDYPPFFFNCDDGACDGVTPNGFEKREQLRSS